MCQKNLAIDTLVILLLLYLVKKNNEPGYFAFYFVYHISLVERKLKDSCIIKINPKKIKRPSLSNITSNKICHLVL